MKGGLKQIRQWLSQRRVELQIAGIVFFSCAYFFQGGGWNQNAFFATTLAVVEHGSINLDNYRESTGDLSRAGEHVVSAKAIATSLAAIPGYLAASILTAPVANPGDQIILKAHITTVLTAGLALTVLALLLFAMLRRRLALADAAILTLAACLATPLFPNSTMLTSHSLACLAALAAYALLESSRLGASPPGPRVLLLAGFAAGAAAACEYMLTVLVAPLGLYALWQCRRRPVLLGWFAGGVLGVLTIPLVHHYLAYGNPFHTGYASLVNPKFAHRAALGFMGFVGFDVGSLFELTFGQIRGFFYLSPFLVAVIPGTIRMIRNPATRPEGLVCGAISWGTLLLVSCLVYWHSGSAVGSRYALVFIPFAAIMIATLFRPYRAWLTVGAGLGLCFMTIATSVTAIPPPPGRLPYENVIRWFWDRFSVGNLASWQQAIILEKDIGAGHPTLPFSYNLGQLMGLPGLWSLLPWLVVLAVLTATLASALRRQQHLCPPLAQVEVEPNRDPGDGDRDILRG